MDPWKKEGDEVNRGSVSSEDIIKDRYAFFQKRSTLFELQATLVKATLGGGVPQERRKHDGLHA